MVSQYYKRLKLIHSVNYDYVKVYYDSHFNNDGKGHIALKYTFFGKFYMRFWNKTIKNTQQVFIFYLSLMG